MRGPQSGVDRRPTAKRVGSFKNDRLLFIGRCAGGSRALDLSDCRRPKPSTDRESGRVDARLGVRLQPRRARMLRHSGTSASNGAKSSAGPPPTSPLTCHGLTRTLRLHASLDAVSHRPPPLRDQSPPTTSRSAVRPPSHTHWPSPSRPCRPRSRGWRGTSLVCRRSS